MNSAQNASALAVHHAQQRRKVATLERADVVIIGNGIAGLTAAIEARRYSPNKSIVIMTDQTHPTINTPALKQFSSNKLKSEQLLAYPAGTERSLNIHVVKAHVEKIHAESKYLDLDGNRTFGYDKLLIATGSQPVGLPENMPGRDCDGVITLHRLKDYLDLRRRLPEVREAVVIGGGTHANDVVTSLLYWGIRVHWLIRGKKFLPLILDDSASEIILNQMRRARVVIHTETEVSAIVGRVSSVAGVITNKNEMIHCQLVVSCIGTRPAEGLAAQCTVPMMFNNGILVNNHLRTSVRDIYAAGDVAALLNPQTGEYQTRAQWYSAVMQGKIAGAAMVGPSTITERQFGVQWHATRLGQLSMLTVGDPLGVGINEDIALYTDISRGSYRRLVTVGDRLVGYLSISNAPVDGLSIKRLIDEGISIRDLLKPMLKGKVDIHGYLTRTKVHMARTMVQTESLPAMPLFGQLQSLQWPEMPGKEVVYNAESSRLSVGTSFAKYGATGQFARPDFIDTRYNRDENMDVVALPYGQLGEGRVTEALPVSSSTPRVLDKSQHSTKRSYGGHVVSQDLANSQLPARVGV